MEEQSPQIHCNWRGKGVATGSAASVRKVLGYQTESLDYNLWKVTWNPLLLLLTPARPSSKMIKELEIRFKITMCTGYFFCLITNHFKTYWLETT